MIRRIILAGFVFPLLIAMTAPAAAQQAPAVPDRSTPDLLVLPFRGVGVSDTTIAVFADLLVGGLESRGVAVLDRPDPARIASGVSDLCDEAACARMEMERHGASRVIYGSIGRLGSKRIVRVHLLRVGDERPFLADQITAAGDEDLDRIAARIAEAIAEGRSDLGSVTVQSVTQQETAPPRLRAQRRGLGVRAGFLFPSGDSYAGVDRMTVFRLPYKYEGTRHLIESTVLGGLAFGSGCVDWTIFDLYLARIYGLKDRASYIGGGLGVHSIHLEKEYRAYYPGDPYYRYYDTNSQNATTIVTEIGGGILLMRTYDFEIVLDCRYRIVFDKFKDIGKDGAHGLVLTFGASG